MAGQVKPIPVPVILAAVNGDEDALAAVVAHYQKYIRALATRPLKDEYGNTYLYVDEDMKKPTYFACGYTGTAGGQRRSFYFAQDRLNRLCPHSHGYRFLSDAVRCKSLAAP